MAAIQFYHLTATQIDRALPKLMEKVIAGNLRALVVADTQQKIDYLDELLWTYDPATFLPHGQEKNGQTDRQPILISQQDEPVNNATLLVVTDGRSVQQPERYTRVLDIFDGRDDDSVARARQRWSLYKAAGHELTYLKQTESGGWQQPA